MQEIWVDPEAGQGERWWSPPKLGGRPSPEAGWGTRSWVDPHPKLGGPPIEAGWCPIMWLGPELGWRKSGLTRKRVKPKVGGLPQLGGCLKKTVWLPPPTRSCVVRVNVVGPRIGLQESWVDPKVGQAESGWTPEAGCAPPRAGWTRRSWVVPDKWWLRPDLGCTKSGLARKRVKPESGWTPAAGWLPHNTI